MKILVISFRFPPYSSVGAVSVGKTAKYLVALGHDVRVVSARDQQVPATVPLEVDGRSVVTTGWLNPMRIAQPAVGGSARVEAIGFSAGRKHARAVHRVGRSYRRVMIPDEQIGWAWPAFRAGRRIVDGWSPDVIYASAPPFTSLITAAALGFRTGIPWVAGLRDLWSHNPYRDKRFARLDRALESRVLGSAAAIVVTTQEAEDVIRARFRAPVTTVTNGYDPDDMRERTVDASGARPLEIVHTGILMRDRRDPTPLFEAMRALRADDRRVSVDFYGRDSLSVTETAEGAGVADLVRAHGPISYEDSLQAQRDADVLLLIQPIDPVERGICPAKIFEYAAARRPVLAIAPPDGVVARLITGSGLGVVVQRADEIASELRGWHDRKVASGRLPDVADRPPRELSRALQIQRLSDFLEGVVPSSRSGNRTTGGRTVPRSTGLAWRP